MESRPAKIAIYALTRQGCALGAALCEKLAGAKTAELHTPARLGFAGDNPFSSLASRVAELFHRRECHIFIAATGIAVRVIAPHLKGKDRDPAVLAMDQDGQHVISLLSGHLGGANDLARFIAGLTGGKAVITTATDSAGLPSLDTMAQEQGMVIGNLNAVKRANAALLDGRTVQVYDPENRLEGTDDPLFQQIDDPQLWDPDQPGVWVDWRTTAPGEQELRLYPRVIHAGLGCRRGVPGHEIQDHLQNVLAESGVAMQSLKSLATIEEKRDETGLTETGAALGVPIQYYTKDQLEEVEDVAPSELVQRHMGVKSVCEAAAILASKGRLIRPKMKTSRVTCALAVSSF